MLCIDFFKLVDLLWDCFIFSKGYGVVVLFQVLVLCGFYLILMLDDYGKDGGIFVEYFLMFDYLFGIEVVIGLFGYGLLIGLGMVLVGCIQ